MGVRWAFSDRHGGVGAPPYDTFNVATHVGDDPEVVAVNRERLSASLSSPPPRVVFMDQVHGDSVAVVGRSRSGSTKW